MRRALLGLLAIFLVVTTAACSGGGSSHEGEVQMPASSSAYVGEHYDVAVEELESAGFTNVQTKALGDLITGWLKDDGEVEKIRIDGSNNFSKGDWFPADTKILITYHSFPEEEPQEETPVEEATPVPETAAVASDEELAQAVEAFNRERAAAGVLWGEAFVSASASNGIVSVTYDPAQTAVDADSWHSMNPFDNMARFACDPFAWATSESTHLRTSLVRVDTFWADGSSAGSMTLEEIKALNDLD